MGEGDICEGLFTRVLAACRGSGGDSDELGSELSLPKETSVGRPLYGGSTRIRITPLLP
jgi:hypothetical protein